MGGTVVCGCSELRTHQNTQSVGMKNLSPGKGTDTPTGDTEALLQHRTGGKSWGHEDAECRGTYS